MVSVLDAGPTMLPPEELLTDVLPTDRLTATGMPVPELRTELRRIDDLRNVGTVVATWAQALGTIGLAVWIGHPLAYAAAFVLMGPAFARFAILGHEAAHKLLFTNKRWNDWVGRWVVAYPSFVPLDAYRRGHFAHHKDEFGPGEPDLNLYNGYPITEASFRRKMWRDARGSSGWKNLKGLLRAFQSKDARPVALRIARHAAAADRGGHRHRPLVAVPVAVARPVDDVVARHQPAPLDRRARRHDAVEGPSPDHAPRAADLARPVLDGAAQHRAGTSRTTSTWACRGATCPSSTPSSRPPATSPPSSPTRATAPCGAPCARDPRSRSYGSTTTGSPWRMVPGSRTQA